jgi:hypothetical protein
MEQRDLTSLVPLQNPLQHPKSDIDAFNEAQHLQPVEKTIVQKIPKFVDNYIVVGGCEQMVRPETAGIREM